MWPRTGRLLRPLPDVETEGPEAVAVRPYARATPMATRGRRGATPPDGVRPLHETVRRIPIWSASLRTAAVPKRSPQGVPSAITSNRQIACHDACSNPLMEGPGPQRLALLPVKVFCVRPDLCTDEPNGESALGAHWARWWCDQLVDLALESLAQNCQGVYEPCSISRPLIFFFNTGMEVGV